MTVGLFALGVCLCGAKSPPPDIDGIAALRDLAAQESIAASTREVVHLTRIQIFLASIGAIAVLASLELSRRSLRITRSAVESQVDTARFQLRAYIGVLDGKELENNLGSITLTTRFKNFGQTPALEVREWVETWSVDGFGHYYPVNLSTETRWSYRGTVQPGATFSFRHNFNLTNVQRAAARTKAKSLLSVAVYSYRDVFGHSHVTAVSQVFGGPSLANRVVNFAFDSNHPEVSRILEIEKLAAL